MTIKILAKHFAGAKFGISNECPIANAIKDAHPLARPIVGFSFAWIGNRAFTMDVPYHEPDYISDAQIAAEQNYGLSIIREIQLNEIQ